MRVSRDHGDGLSCTTRANSAAPSCSPDRIVGGEPFELHWSHALARANPFFYVVGGMRDTLARQYATASLAVGFTVAVALTAVSLTIGALTFGRENA